MGAIKPASFYKMQADLAAFERLAERNLNLGEPWDRGADVTHLNINQETVAELERKQYRVERSDSRVFVRWR